MIPGDAQRDDGPARPPKIALLPPAVASLALLLLLIGIVLTMGWEPGHGEAARELAQIGCVLILFSVPAAVVGLLCSAVAVFVRSWPLLPALVGLLVGLATFLVLFVSLARTSHEVARF